MGENHFAALASAVYGFILLAAAIAYALLQQCNISVQRTDSALRRAIGSDWKGKLSRVLHVLGILLTFVHPPLGQALYVAVALMWLVPDRRIERQLQRDT